MPSRNPERPERSLEEQIHRASQARAILDSEIFRDAVEEAEQEFYTQWLHATRTEAREALWFKMHALGAIEDQLRSIVADGEVAASRGD